MDDTTLNEIQHDNLCAGCSAPLTDAQRQIGFHPNGWRLDGHDGLQWIAFRCPVCGYDTSLDKLGIPRP